LSWGTEAKINDIAAAHARNRGGTEGDIDDRLAAHQISLPHGSIVIALRLLIFMSPEKKLTRGPEQYVSLIMARADGAAGAAFSNTPHVYTAHDGLSLWKLGGVSIEKTTVRNDKWLTNYTYMQYETYFVVS